MKKLLIILGIGVAVLKSVSANLEVNPCSPLTGEQIEELKEMITLQKIQLIKTATKSLGAICINIQQQVSDFPEDLNVVSDIPRNIEDISNILKLVEVYQGEDAWRNNIIRQLEISIFSKINVEVRSTLQELEVTLDKLERVVTRTNVSVKELDSLKSIINRLKSPDCLFPYSAVDLEKITLSSLNNWVTTIQSLPVTVKQLNLDSTNIDASGLRELYRLSSLEEIRLMRVKLSNPSGWASVIQSLHPGVKKLYLNWTNIDVDGLRELSRFNSLEKIDLEFIKLTNREHWIFVIKSLPAVVKKIKLGFTNIDVSGLQELSRFNSLEEIYFGGVKLSYPTDWVVVIQSLPVMVRKLYPGITNIDVDGLRELSRFNSLEEISFWAVELSDPSDWASVIQSLHLGVKKLDLGTTNIDEYGLLKLSHLTSLEEICLYSVKLSDPRDWASVIQSLHPGVKKLNLDSTNIDASGLLELSRLTNLEEIYLVGVKLYHPDEWAYVIMNLPVQIKKIKLQYTNCPYSERNNFRSGVDIGY